MMVGLKGGLSIGGALVASVLGYYGYLAGADQPETALYGIKMLVSIFPSIPFILSVVVLFFYEIDKDMESMIESDLKTKR